MSRAARSDLVDLSLCLHHETERAVLVSDDGDRTRAVWLPKAAIEVERQRDGTVTVTLPERLAHDKGLI